MIEFDYQRKAEQHRVLMDLASHFGYIVLTPDELTEMVRVAAAKRPERVVQLDEARKIFIEFKERAAGFDGVKLLPLVDMFIKDLDREIALRAKNDD